MRMPPTCRKQAHRARRRCGARRARAATRGSYAEAPGAHQRAALWRRQSARRARLRGQGEAAAGDRRLCARQGPARAAGVGQLRRDLAGGRDPARRRRDLSRRAPAGAASTSRSSPAKATGRKPAATAMAGARAMRASSRPTPGRARSTRRCGRRWSISKSVPAPAGEMDVVLGPGWPGVMLHEAVGHGLEGDFNRKKTSAFAGLMGQRSPPRASPWSTTAPSRRGAARSRSTTKARRPTAPC